MPNLGVEGLHLDAYDSHIYMIRKILAQAVPCLHYYLSHEIVLRIMTVVGIYCSPTGLILE